MSINLSYDYYDAPSYKTGEYNIFAFFLRSQKKFA